jgi:HSP20 family molecular chaperone IbpA
MASNTQNPESKNAKEPSLLDRFARKFLTPGNLDVHFDTLTPVQPPHTIAAPMNSQPTAQPKVATAPSKLLERLSFHGTPDEYSVSLGVAGVSRQNISILVMRMNAIIVVKPSKPVSSGNVVQLFANVQGKRCQLQFADAVAQRGHTATLKDGVLTLRFTKEKNPALTWAEPLEVK